MPSNLEKRREQSRKRYAANREAMRAKLNTWRADNPEKVKERNQHFIDTHPDYFADYRRAHAKPKTAKAPKQSIHENADDPRHGTSNGYSNLKCRCTRCRAAWAERMREYTQRRRRDTE